MSEKERLIFMAPAQHITLPAPPDAQWTLDIGGGGEGTMGQWLGRGVVAIDPSERELREAPSGPLKMVADGSQTPFLPGSFDLVTLFFVMMYVPPEKRKKVWREAYRVVKPGGRVLQWGLTIPPYDSEHELYAFDLTIEHPGGVIETGYGTHWDGYQQDIEQHCRWAEDAGFTVSKAVPGDVVFYIEAAKGGSV